MKTYKRLNKCSLIIVLSLTCCAKLSSQDCNFKAVKPGSRLSCLQGVYTTSDEENPGQLTFMITEGFKFLSVSVVKNEFREIILGYVGFQDFNGYPKNKYGEIKTDTFRVCNLNQDGRYYVTVLEKNVGANLLARDMFVQKEYSCDAGTIEVFNRSMTVYEKINFVPYRVYQYIKAQTPKKERDLIKDFKITEKLLRAEVKTGKAYFHDSADDKTVRKAFVVKGDKILVDELRSDWVKVAFEGKQSVTTGWLKKSALDLIQ